MSERANQIVCSALELSPSERAAIIEQLVSSLDRPDALIDALWAKEAEDGIAAYDAGQIEAFDADEVFR
jgi:putative addiction module component (TIGR02574 family)